MAAGDRGPVGRWRFGDGEEARLTPEGAHAALVRSVEPLPLRARRLAEHHARPAFPGTAVVLGGAIYEVVAAAERDGGFVYDLDPWSEGELVRERVVYDAGFVHEVARGRAEARFQARVRPWRALLYPLVGLLPEEDQERLCGWLGLDSVTATLVSGVVESSTLLLVFMLLTRGLDAGAALVVVLVAPALGMLVLPGLGRAFGAAFLRETAGTPLLLPLLTLRSLRGLLGGHRCAHPPLTRRQFWARLRTPDEVEVRPDGGLVFRGVLPHLTWTKGRRVLAGGDYWEVEPLEPEQRGSQLVHACRLSPLTATGVPPDTLPTATAYADEVLLGVQREWDSWNAGLSWITSLLSREVQARAFERRGGPAAARGATRGSAVTELALGAWILHFLPGPPGDPLAPAMGVFSLLLLLDGVLRLRASFASRYAPSLFRWLLPVQLLRPERLAFRAHQQAERAAQARAAGRADAPVA